jgi:bifunctional non-homologous end joining protein LigD
MATQESIALFYREGSSDKVFNVQLTQQGDGWIVNSQNGRRGSTLINREVTKGVVGYEVAKAAYDSKVKSKLKDGYTTDESGSVYASSELAGRFSGHMPQLLNAIDEIELESLIRDDRYVAQQKFDGERLMVDTSEKGIQGSNKKGLIVGLAQTIHDDIKALNQDVLFDGEAVGDIYYVFDILRINGQDLKQIPLGLRLKALAEFQDSEHIKFVKTAYTSAEKRTLLMRVGIVLGEGIVLKDLNAAYETGRPSSGGPALKYKLVESCSVVITGQHATKRSVSYAVYDGDQLVDIGNATIPSNHEIPEPQQVCEIQYLYAYEGGSLFQPVYKGKRSDVDANECVIQQLKFKAESVAA